MINVYSFILDAIYWTIIALIQIKIAYIQSMPYAYPYILATLICHFDME